MIKFIKISSIILVVLLFLVTLILITFQSLLSIIAIPTGILFLYYSVVLALTFIIKKQNPNQVYIVLIGLLFFTPLIWCLIDPTYLFELLTPNLNLDMK